MEIYKPKIYTLPAIKSGLPPGTMLPYIQIRLQQTENVPKCFFKIS